MIEYGIPAEKSLFYLFGLFFANSKTKPMMENGYFKNFIKSFIPPILITGYRLVKKTPVLEIKPKIWSGNYETWASAKINCTGYDDPSILEKCRNALLAVKKGKAVYERDSVLFNEIQYSWGLLAGLQKVALENNGRLCVLDFGGSLGSTYYQNKAFLDELKGLQWCIVEQRNFVDCGKEYFENEQLKFYYSYKECLLNCKPNVLLLSSVLQYLENPYEWIAEFISLKIPYIIIDRTSIIYNGSDILTVQNVPENIYVGSYPAWFFNNEKFNKQFINYKLLASFDAHEGYVMHLENGLSGSYKGYILKYNYDN